MENFRKAHGESSLSKQVMTRLRVCTAQDRVSFGYVDIHSRLDRYKADEEITAVWIWAEEVSDGLYDIYIGYA